MNIPTWRLRCNVCDEYIDAKGYEPNIDVTCLNCIINEKEKEEDKS